MEIELDFWGLVEPLLPLLEEIERVEAMAAGKTESDGPTADEQEGQGQQAGPQA